MLKKDITFDDFDGNTVTETHYFNLTAPEVVKAETSIPGGYANWLQEIVKTRNGAAIMDAFEDLIRRSYGVRSSDGRRFVKSEELYEEFRQSGAYEELFMSIVTNAAEAAEFFNGIMPQKAIARVNEAMAQAAELSLNDLPDAIKEEIVGSPAEVSKILDRIRATKS